MKSQNKKVYDISGHYDKSLSPNVDAAWSRFQKEMKLKSEAKTVRGNFSQLLAIAAGAAILLAAFFVFNNSSASTIQTIQTADNEIRQVDLPDGSKVWINERSNLSVSDFNASTRRVALEGEAFFEVVPNADKPFIVESGDLNVKVLGTSFNVRNYLNETKEVEVREGKVQVNKEGVPEAVILKKSDKISISESDKKLIKSTGSVENVGGWTSKSLVFNDQPLGEVIAQIERMYEVKISIREQSLADCLFKTNFANAPLSEIMEVIQIAFGCEIEEKVSGGYVLKGGSCN